MSHVGRERSHPGHSVESVTATRLLFGPVGSVVLPLAKNAQALPGSATGDRDSVNSARPTRTRFYSARSTRGGIATAASGDCEEMNPPAASHRFCDAGRENPIPPRITERPPWQSTDQTM